MEPMPLRDDNPDRMNSPGQNTGEVHGVQTPALWDRFK